MAARLAAAPAAPPPPPAGARLSPGLLSPRRLRLFRCFGRSLLMLAFYLRLLLEGAVDLDRRRLRLANAHHPFTAGIDQGLRTLHLIARHDEDRNLIVGFDRQEMIALFVEDVEGDLAVDLDR